MTRRKRSAGDHRVRAAANAAPPRADSAQTTTPRSGSVRTAPPRPGRAPAPRRRPRSFPAFVLPAVAVALAALLAYANATPPVAIHDDSFFVPARHTLSASSVAGMFVEDMWSSTGSPAGVYRPLVVLSIAVNGALFGKDPTGYHATNVAMHALASVVVFLLLLQLLGSGQAWVAALAAALFAVHPIHTEAVDSVYNRSEILATTGVAAALWVVHRWHERRPAVAWTAGAVLYLLALLCRESAVSLPALAALMLWLAHPAEPARMRLRRVLPVATLAIPLIAYFVLRHFALASTVQSSAPVLGVDAGRDLVSRFFYSVAALREYARMMVLPWPLRVSYEDFRGDGLLAAVITHVVLIGTAVGLRRRAPLATFAVAFFYVALLPSTRLFTSAGLSLQIGDFVILQPQSGLVLIGERVAYLPSVALAIAAGVALAELARRRGLLAATASAAPLLIVGGLITVERNAAWHSAPALFSAEVVAAPDNGDGWRLLVSALSSAGRFEEATSACDGQLEGPTRSAQFFNNCGVVYDKLRRDESAMKAYRRAIELGLAPVGHANLGRVYVRLGRIPEAEAEFAAAAEAETNPAQRHYRTGVLLMRFHPERAADARREFEAALEIQPDYVAARQALGQLAR